MADRLTDADLDELAELAEDAIVAEVSGWVLLVLVAEVREHRAARTLTTYRMADGSEVWGEYAWVGDAEYFEGADPPVEVIRERWALVESETLTLPEESPDA